MSGVLQIQKAAYWRAFDVSDAMVMIRQSEISVFRCEPVLKNRTNTVIGRDLEKNVVRM